MWKVDIKVGNNEGKDLTKGTTVCSFWVLSEELVWCIRNVCLQLCKSADLVKINYCGKYTPFPMTLKHLCSIPVMHCYKSKENLGNYRYPLACSVSQLKPWRKGLCNISFTFHFKECCAVSSAKLVLISSVSCWNYLLSINLQLHVI